MTLDPRDRKSWEGFFDQLQPPSGYRLSAAFGTSFGVSIDALTAALLAMCDADGEELANDPIAGVLALTRLRSKVRVLVHPGTISGRVEPGGSRLVALLDRLIVEIQPVSGLFHPKVWALRFDRIGSTPEEPDAIGRVLVSSRNLSPSTCFELGAIFEGPFVQDGKVPSAFGADVADALRAWMTAGKSRMPDVVWKLPHFIRRVDFASALQDSQELRLRWQGAGRPPLGDLLPKRIQRALVVSPFLRAEFIVALANRAQHLHIISTAEALDGLDDETYASLEAMQATQQAPVLYQIGAIGEEDGGFIEGLHAKLVLVEDAQKRGITFVGSANGTGPGWGLGGPSNVEAMVEMRPGIGVDRFMEAFVRESKSKLHPWVTEYDRSARQDSKSEREAERLVLAALRDIARADFVLQYDATIQRLTVVRPAKKITVGSRHEDIKFAFAPLLLTDRPDGWHPLETLTSGGCSFDDVPLERVTAFIAIRGRGGEPIVERTRLVLGRLELADEQWDERDSHVRHEFLATADPAVVLNALVRGLSYVSAGPTSTDRRTPGGKAALRQLFLEANLERLLQVVAVEPALVSEMRLLLGVSGGDAFQQFCADLDQVLQQVGAELTP